MAADLFESSVITLLGTYPLAIGARGLVARAAGAQFTRLPASNSKRAIAT